MRWLEVMGGSARPVILLGTIDDGALHPSSVAQIGGAGAGGGEGARTPMPTGDVVSNGVTWTPVRSEDFTTPAAIGAFRTTYSSVELYVEGSGDGKYLGDQTVSADDSMMDIHCHHIGSVDAGAAVAILNPSGDWDWIGGRFAIRFRADASAVGYGSAFQLWPSNDVWAEGEMDFPEGGFDGGINLYHHRVGANPEVNYLVASDLGAWSSWHTAVIEWRPGNSVRYYLDDVLVGQVTDPAQVATTAHHWIIQAASHDATADGAPNSSSGHLQVDWFVAYAAT